MRGGVLVSRQLTQQSRVIFHSCYLGPTLPEEAVSVNAHKIVSKDESLYYMNTYNNLFYKLICSISIEDCYWKKLEHKLEYPRQGAVAMMLPDYLEHMVDCG